MKIYTRNHCHKDTNKPMCFQGFEKKREVVIYDDVWIGARTIILLGVEVEEGQL